MRVLFLAPRHPDTATTGAELRDASLARELSRLGTVVQVGFAGPSSRDATNHGGGSRRSITIARERFSLMRAVAQSLVTPAPLSVLTLYSPRMAHALARLLGVERFDVALVHSVLMAAYVPVLRRAPYRLPIICDWHNIESEIQSRYATHASWPHWRWIAHHQARRMAAYERAAVPAFDAHFAVSDRDRDALQAVERSAKVFRVDNGIDAANYTDEQLHDAHARWVSCGGQPLVRRRVLFVGSMDYRANVEAVSIFAKTIWPIVRAARPDLVFTVVGRAPRRAVRALATQPGIEVTGTVDDVRPYYREALLSVVPLEIGGGSRVKILEAFAAGVPVVSSPTGAEGLDVIDGQHLLIARRRRAFAAAILDVAARGELRADLVAAGRRIVEDRYDWRSIGRTVQDACREVIESDRVLTSSPPRLAAAPEPRVATG